jgi:hypothetical protein
VGPDVLHQADVPVFDLKKATTVVPEVDWAGFHQQPLIEILGNFDNKLLKT